MMFCGRGSSFRLANSLLGLPNCTGKWSYKQLTTPGSHVALTCSISAQDIWVRKYHELWEKLRKKTKDSLCTALWKWIVSFFD